MRSTREEFAVGTVLGSPAENAASTLVTAMTLNAPWTTRKSVARGLRHDTCWMEIVSLMP